MATGGDDTRSHEPHDRLTRLCAAMTETLRAHPECGDVQCVVFLESESERRSGLVMDGYEDDVEAVAAVFLHLQAILRANGKTMTIVPMGKGLGHG